MCHSVYRPATFSLQPSLVVVIFEVRAFNNSYFTLYCCTFNSFSRQVIFTTTPSFLHTCLHRSLSATRPAWPSQQPHLSTVVHRPFTHSLTHSPTIISSAPRRPITTCSQRSVCDQPWSVGCLYILPYCCYSRCAPRRVVPAVFRPTISAVVY